MTLRLSDGVSRLELGSVVTLDRNARRGGRADPQTPTLRVCGTCGIGGNASVINIGRAGGSRVIAVAGHDRAVATAPAIAPVGDWNWLGHRQTRADGDRSCK